MVYRVYTDAATRFKEGISSVAYLILKDSRYLHSHSEIINENTISKAESYAVGIALQYVINVIDPTPEDTLVVLSDSLYTVNFAKKCVQKKNGSKTVRIVRPVKCVRLLGLYDTVMSINCPIKFSKIQAHQDNKNPNSYVDRLATTRLSLDSL